MPKPSAYAQRRLAYGLWLVALVFFIYALMGTIAGVNPAAYPYNSYLLQARAWLQGRMDIPGDYEYLELAVFGGRQYVSFPPVPSLPMVVLTLLMGENVPGGLVQKLYLCAACLAVFFEITRSRKITPLQGFLWTLGICLGSAMLPVGLIGGVWYEAQILAFLFEVCAISALRRGRLTLACLCYALGVGCRPFTALLGPVLLAMYLGMHRREAPGKTLRRLAPGVCIGLLIAAAYGAYNYARFGNIFEFGHNHLPEFTRAEHGQLSLHYVPGNFRQMFFGSPFTLENGRLAFYKFGFSMFLSCPILICGGVWLIQDLLKRRMTAAKWTMVIAGCLNIFLLMMHRTLGGHQFGLRYALELVPLCLCYLLESPHRRATKKWELALLGFGLIFNFIGGCRVHI